MIEGKILIDNKRLGASPEEWSAVIANDILSNLIIPVVPPGPAWNYPIPINAGKVPSRKNKYGHAILLKGWNDITFSTSELMDFAKDPDIGFGCKTGFNNVLAVDVDCDDPEICSEIKEFLAFAADSTVDSLNCRIRANSPRFAALIHIKNAPESLFSKKRIIEISQFNQGKVEILAKGSQLVCCGTHPSGARLTWTQGAPDIIELEYNEFSMFINKIGGKITEVNTSERPTGTSTNDYDSLAKWIIGRKEFISKGSEDQIFLECPWKDLHTQKTQPKDTVFFPNGSRGAGRAFKCLHAHCSSKNISDFIAWATENGFTETSENDYPDIEIKSCAIDPFLKFRNEKTGAISPTLESIEIALSNPEFCEHHLAFDDFSSSTMIRCKNEDKWKQYQDEDATKIRLIIEKKGFSKTSKQDVIDVLHMKAMENEMDVMRTFLDSKIPEWDKIKRIDNFFFIYCNSKIGSWETAVSRYMFTALWARAYGVGGDKGIKADVVPVLIGEQGCGKSSMARILALDDDLCGSIDFEKTFENLARSMREKIIMEIPELGGMTRKEQNSIKAFITEKVDCWVPKYRETERRAPRRCIFIMTTNDYEFLSDRTGNRRWAPIEVKKINFKELENDLLQLWAEGRELYNSHGILYNDVDKMSSEMTEDYTIQDSWETMINSWLKSNDSLEEDIITTKIIFERALHVEFSQIKKSDQMRLGAIMRKIGFKRTRKMINGHKDYVWEPL